MLILCMLNKYKRTFTHIVNATLRIRNIYFIGVDVGTSSARAGLVTSKGKVIKQAVNEIRIWNQEQNHYEQSSRDVWNAVCTCVKDITKDVPKEKVVSISFDATCSVAIFGKNGEPISASNSKEPERNIILWLDHRAKKEAAEINATKHEILKYVGGQVSIEMELPKLKWLKANHSSTWKKLWRAFDLPDFLTWRATDSDTRSLCSTVCKWNYDAVKMEWNKEFFKQIGLEELLENQAEIIGKEIKVPGSPVGNGLSERAAKEMNLRPGIFVGTSLIDAHAGALGLFGCRSSEINCEVQAKMALICGTSTCHMSLTKEPCLAKGIWGPYRSAIIPDYYLNEGGQSAAGLLLDHITETHFQHKNVKPKLKDNENASSYLNRLLKQMATERNLDDTCYLTKDLHVWPDFHGNRSPIADSSLQGMICGLNMNVDEEALAVLYLGSVQALAYGTRHIIETLIKYQRIPFEMLLFCGGLAKNEIYVQSHADACQTPALIPDEEEMVLAGASMLGACAAKVFDSLEAASAAMGGTGKLLKPNVCTKDYHDRKYKVFLEMLSNQYKYRQIMQ